MEIKSGNKENEEDRLKIKIQVSEIRKQDAGLTRMR